MIRFVVDLAVKVLVILVWTTEKILNVFWMFWHILNEAGYE
jgi:hypothetical protein